MTTSLWRRMEDRKQENVPLTVVTKYHFLHWKTMRFFFTRKQSAERTTIGTESLTDRDLLASEDGGPAAVPLLLTLEDDLSHAEVEHGADVGDEQESTYHGEGED
jgi:hypothetical protein